jgi:hypothetical protein
MIIPLFVTCALKSLKKGIYNVNTLNREIIQARLDNGSINYADAIQGCLVIVKEPTPV